MAKSTSSAGTVPDADRSGDTFFSTSTSDSNTDTSTNNDVISTPVSVNCSFYYPRRLRVQYSCGDQLITKQEFRDECDINTILSQYKRTGIINHIMAQPPIYGDLPDITDYQTSLETFRTSQAAFDALPATVRRYFQNDPSQLLAAIGNPEMRTTLEELGILQGPATPQPPGNPANTNPSLAPTLRTAPELPPPPSRPQAPAPAASTPSSPPSSPATGTS